MPPASERRAAADGRIGAPAATLPVYCQIEALDHALIPPQNENGEFPPSLRDQSPRNRGFGGVSRLGEKELSRQSRGTIAPFLRQLCCQFSLLSAQTVGAIGSWRLDPVIKVG